MKYMNHHNRKKLFSKHELQFIMWFCIIFLVSIGLLAALGLIPSEFKFNGGETFEQKTRNAIRQIIEGNTNATNPPRITNKPNTVITGTNGNGGQNGIGTGTNTNPQNIAIVANTGETIYAEEPVRINIPAIGVNSIIKNPTSTNHETLDAELTKGVVRYPGSGFPGSGNMFLFGHSTGFSLVQNQAYKVFNRLKDMKNGDTITIHGTVATYEYRVTSVKKVDKESTLVSFDTKKNMITLSTCDSFGKAADRFVVEGELVSVVKK